MVLGGTLTSQFEVERDQNFGAGGWRRDNLVGKSKARNVYVASSNPVCVSYFGFHTLSELQTK